MKLPVPVAAYGLGPLDAWICMSESFCVVLSRADALRWADPFKEPYRNVEEDVDFDLIRDSNFRAVQDP